MKLVIVHYHLRPGGVRRIIELATPYLVGRLGKVEKVVLAAGEAADGHWNAHFGRALEPTPLEFLVEPAFRYISEQDLPIAVIRRRTRLGLGRVLEGQGPGDALVWAHNLGIGRNLVLTQELVSASEGRGIPVVAHHHDWWFDNRWQRRREMRRCGFRSLEAVAKTIFATGSDLRHVGINRADASILESHFGVRAGWLPNLVERRPLPSAERLVAVRAWLRQKAGSDGPVWILPSRLLRRKNAAEALLLTRWLHPEACLVVTGGVSSVDEQAYASNLNEAARRHRWPLRCGVLEADEASGPNVPELLAASECVLFTSIQEGFGLPYLEAVAAKRPLIARMLPNIAPDLDRFGFRFPYSYRDVLILPELFDWPAEQRRQEALFRSWLSQLPRACRRLAAEPMALACGGCSSPLPFSRLTLTAQLEVLSHPSQYSWEACRGLNPFLEAWRRHAAAGLLRPTGWPRQADKWLSGPAYARRFLEILRRRPRRPLATNEGAKAQEEFIRLKLGADHLYPLLWKSET